MAEQTIGSDTATARPEAFSSEPAAGAEPATSGDRTPNRMVTRAPGIRESNPRKFTRRRRRTEITLGVAIPVLLVLGWQLASKTGAIDRRFFPAPSDLWPTGVRLYRNGTMENLLGSSYRRMFEGFFIGCGAGLVLGFFFGTFGIVRAAFEPTIYALWTVPKLALLPLLLLIFGLGEAPIIVLIAIECCFLVMIPTTTAVATVPTSYREVATSFGASRLQTLRRVILPAALPQMFVSLRLAAGAAVLVMVAGEFIDGKPGVGYFIFNSWQLFATNQMYVGIVSVAVTGGVWMLLVSLIGRFLTRWQRGTTE